MKALNIGEQSFIEDLVWLLEKHKAEISVEYRNCIDYSEDFILVNSECNGIRLDLNECINYLLLETPC